MAFFNKRSVDRYYWPLKSGDIVAEGSLVCLNSSTGKVVLGDADPGLVPVGFAAQAMTGDGTTKLCVQLFKPVNIYGLTNDSGTALTLAGQLAYVLNGTTVTGSPSDATVAGIVFEIDTSYVWVCFDMIAASVLALAIAAD